MCGCISTQTWYNINFIGYPSECSNELLHVGAKLPIEFSIHVMILLGTTSVFIIARGERINIFIIAHGEWINIIIIMLSRTDEGGMF